jgi:hypothetical protein
LLVGRSFCNDVTCFSNGYCNVRCLVETALWPLSFLLEVLGGIVSPRRTDHPCSLGLLVSYNSAVGPLAQARDKTRQEEEEEHADHNLRRVTIERRKKGLRSSTKIYFMRLKTETYLA